MKTSSYARCRCTYAAWMKVWSAGVVVMLAVAAPSLSAQTTTGSITGIVSSSDGARLPHAQITAIEQSSGRQARGSSDHLGAFVFYRLPHGTYSVLVEFPGFAPRTLSDIVVGAGPVPPLTMILQPQELREVVTVSRSLPRGGDDGAREFSARCR